MRADPPSRSRLRSLRARLADERGQSYVEWLGGTVLMIIIVLAVLAARPGLGSELRCQAGAQIDRILSIDQSGACHEPAPERDKAAGSRGAQDRADRRAVHGRPGR